MKRQASITSYFQSPKRARIDNDTAEALPDHPYHAPPTPFFNHPITIHDRDLGLVFNNAPRLITKPADLDVMYFDRFLDSASSQRLFNYLLDELPWYRVNYTVRNIDIKTPRYTTVFGKDATHTPWTSYSDFKPRAIPQVLLQLKQKVTNAQYNFCLVNYYADGRDSISYHSDGERFLGPNPCIASLSLGGSRDFVLRHVDYKARNIPVQKFTLMGGDMVVMRGTTQHKWQHSIPKRARADGRINITFRKGITLYSTENYLTYNVGTGPMYRWRRGEMHVHEAQ